MNRRRRVSGAGIEAVIMLLFVALLVPAGVVGWAIGNRSHGGATPAAVTQPASTPVDPQVAAGAHAFVGFACAKCHGIDGRGGVSPDVPALTNAGASLTVAQLKKIIHFGLGVASDPTKPYMPVWNHVISERQISDLVSYIRAGLPAVQYATSLPVPTDQGTAVQGAALYQVYGCENCHGPNGLGGVPNPSAPDKTIPPLSGADFRAQFNTDKKVIDFIRSGSVLGKAPIVSMPHWGGIIPPQEMQALADYLKTFQ